MKKRIILFALLFIHIGIFSQQSDGKFLSLLKINNNDLRSAVQQVIDHDKDCLYYSDSITFYLSINETSNSPGDYSVRFEAISSYHTISICKNQSNGNSLKLEYVPIERYSINNYSPILGYFLEGKHLFIVIGQTYSDLFTKTNQTQWFSYKKHIPNEFFFNDDSFSIFQYWYVDNKLHLGEIYGCEKKSEKINSDNSQKTIKESN